MRNFFYRNVTHTVIWLQVPKWIRASLGCSAPQERWCTSRFFILKGINCNCSFALKLFYWWPNWFSFYLMWFFNASFNKISQVNNIISSFYSISYFWGTYAWWTPYQIWFLMNFPENWNGYCIRKVSLSVLIVGTFKVVTY